MGQANQINDIYNVTRLNREARAILEGSFPEIWVQAEISNFAQPASGHIYFSLKDEHSQVRCAMFRNRQHSLQFIPENGMLVLVKANVSLYEDRGEFQLIVEYIEQAGDGALQLAFEELKKRLFNEGLFDEEHKKEIPSMPESVGIITSPSGAAIRDILSTLKRRYPSIKIIIYPTSVQGEGAADNIIRMLSLANKRNECDVLILSRGGGSLEDLWAFSNEKVARTIYKSNIPIVTGIGHEIDFTIADFVADKRAPTPSSAAEIVSPDQIQINFILKKQDKKFYQLANDKIINLKQNIRQLGRRLPHPARQLQTLNQRLDGFYLRMFHYIDSEINTRRTSIIELENSLNYFNPVQTIKIYDERCNQIKKRLRFITYNNIQRLNGHLTNLRRALEAMSPQSTLERGYAISMMKDNKEIVRNAKYLSKGDIIQTRFAQGEATSIVDEVFVDHE
jgi:exodeoxyribonuclease VII large subunit